MELNNRFIFLEEITGGEEQCRSRNKVKGF
jgi:hypothetical protein